MLTETNTPRCSTSETLWSFQWPSLPFSNEPIIDDSYPESYQHSHQSRKQEIGN